MLSFLQRRHKTPKRLARGTPRLGENNGASGAPASWHSRDTPHDGKGRPQEGLLTKSGPRGRRRTDARGHADSFPPPAGPQFPRPCGAKLIGSCCYSLLKPCRRPNWPALKPGTPSHLGADEGRPNTAAAPLTREQASERVLGFGGWWVVSCCQSHRCHREMAARVEACCLLHSTQEATARVGNVRRLQRREQQQKTSIDCAVGLGGLHGLGIGWPTTCFAGDHLTASRRDMFDNERSGNI